MFWSLTYSSTLVYSILFLSLFEKFVIIKKGEFVGPLEFWWWLHFSKYVFRDFVQVDIRLIVIVDSTYGLVHGNIHVKRFQEMLEEYITWDVKWRQEVYCSQVWCSSKLEFGDSAVFPNWSQFTLANKFYLLFFS